mmetsp:Transcript_80287/g.222053  ORF Transcript_80287/g.222053 Transcript_80287/m.222053 type:complete len:204 (+) Transcript_80287:499-1110(+)
MTFSCFQLLRCWEDLTHCEVLRCCGSLRRWSLCGHCLLHLRRRWGFRCLVMRVRSCLWGPHRSCRLLSAHSSCRRRGLLRSWWGATLKLCSSSCQSVLGVHNAVRPALVQRHFLPKLCDPCLHRRLLLLKPRLLGSAIRKLLLELVEAPACAISVDIPFDLLSRTHCCCRSRAGPLHALLLQGRTLGLDALGQCLLQLQLLFS